MEGGISAAEQTAVPLSSVPVGCPCFATEGRPQAHGGRESVRCSDRAHARRVEASRKSSTVTLTFDDVVQERVEKNKRKIIEICAI